MNYQIYCIQIIDYGNNKMDILISCNMENYINSAESKALNNHFNFILPSKIFFMYVNTFAFMYICARRLKRPEGPADPPELKLQMVVS